MKTILSMLAIVLACQFTTAQAKMTSVVTADEYKSMNVMEKRLADYVNSAVYSLKALKLNGADASKYKASISISANEKSKLTNNIAIGENDNVPVENAQSCVICGIGSARICFKRIMTTLGNGQPVIITVTEVQGGDCVQLTWD